VNERKEALKRRTKAFAVAVVRFYTGLDRGREEIRVIGYQLLRSGTSVGANDREASRARSEAEFISKIDQCAQEADESQFWLELLQDDCGVPTASVQPVWREADELIAIFVTMSRNTKERVQN
jgi:four helix bundle protein